LAVLAVTASLDIRNAALARRAAKADPWQLVAARPIGKEDLLLLHAVTRSAPNPKAPLAKIRDPHHMMAKMLAKGKSRVEISAVLGYNTSSIIVLERDPSFRELVAHYTSEEVFAEADISAQIKHVALTAMSIIQERLEAEPETFSNKELRELGAAGLDRIGHGPSSSVKVSNNDPSSAIQALKDLLAGEGRGRVLPKAEIEATFKVISDGENSASQRSPESGVNG
jgi:hypothetical protein